VCGLSVCVRQGENIKLDPELHEACSDDISKHCAGVKAGKAAVSTALFTRQMLKCSGDIDDSASLLTVLWSKQSSRSVRVCLSGQ